jgi:hypothetical protein
MRKIKPGQISLILVILGPLLLFGRMLLSGEVLFWGTPMLQFVPWHRIAINSMRLGELPLWNPMVGMGAPLLANLQSALIYPPNLLLLLVGPEHGHGYLVTLHLIFAGIGMVLLARQLGIGPFGQLLAGLSFSLSGYMVARAWFISINHAAAWLPWIIYFADRLLEKFGERPGFKHTLPASLGLTLSLSLQWLAGHAQTAWYSLLLLVVWIIWRIRKDLSRDTLAWVFTRFLFASCLAFAITAAQLLPTIEYLSLSQRAASLDREFALTYSFWPWKFLGLFFPNLFGSPASGDYWGYGNFWEDAIYIGTLPILLGLWAIWRGLQRAEDKTSLERFLFILSCATALLALGKNTPIFPFLFDYIPTFDLFQAPARWNLLLIFSLSILAAKGAERWSTPRARGLYWTRLLTAGAGIIAFASYLGARVIPQIEPSFVRSFAVSGVFLTITGLLTLFLPKERLKLKIGIVGSFILLDLFFIGRGLNPSTAPTVFEGNVLGTRGVAPNERIFIPSELEERLKFEETHRFDTFSPGFDWGKIREIAIPNTSLLDGVASINNFDPMVPERYARFLDVLEEMEPTEQNELLAWTGVSYRIAPDPDDARLVIFQPLPTSGRVHLMADSVVASTPEEALALLSSVEFDIDTQVILENGSQTQGSEGDAGAILAVSEPGPNSISISVEMQTDGWLVLADTWYPGWKARLDGSLVEIHRANYLFRGVTVPEGQHTIEFFYQPRSFGMGSVISLTGLVIVFSLGYICYRRD